jgi:hypothetical protein
MGPLLPVMVLVCVSVAVTVWLPAVTSVTPLVKVCTPLSATCTHQDCTVDYEAAQKNGTPLPSLHSSEFAPNRPITAESWAPRNCGGCLEAAPLLANWRRVPTAIWCPAS